MIRLLLHSIRLQILRFRDQLQTFPPKTVALLVLVAIMLVGALVRWADIGTESLWVDELYSLRQAVKPIDAIITNSTSDVHPPVYYIVLHWWVLFFGTTPAAVRGLSAVLGVCAIPALYALGARVRGRRVGLYAAFFLALSHFHIHYSQEARSYSYVVLVVIFGMHSCIRLLHEYDGRRQHTRFSRSNTAWFLCAMTLVLYSHFFALFVVVAQNVFVASLVLWRKEVFVRLWKRWLLLQCVLLVVFAPWLNILYWQIQQVRTGGFWIERPTPFVLGETIIEFAGSIAAACVILPLCALAWVKVRRFSSESPLPLIIRASNPAQLLMLALWLVLPILIPYVQSRDSTTPIYYVKYTIPALPALLLLAALGLDSLPVHLRQWRIAVAAVVLLVCGIAWHDTRNDWNTLEKETWKQAAEFLDRTVARDDAVFVHQWYGKYSIAYYAQRKDIVFQSLPPERFVVKPLTVQRFLAPLAAGRDHVWLVLSHKDQKTRTVLAEIERDFTVGSNTVFPSRYRKYMVRDSFPFQTEGVFLMKTYLSNDITIVRYDRKFDRKFDGKSEPNNQ
jgi:mannosyltransferase